MLTLQHYNPTQRWTDNQDPGKLSLPTSCLLQTHSSLESAAGSARERLSHTACTLHQQMLHCTALGSAQCRRTLQLESIGHLILTFLCWEKTKPRVTAVRGEGLAPVQTAASQAQQLQCKVKQTNPLARSRVQYHEASLAPCSTSRAQVVPSPKTQVLRDTIFSS